MRDNITVKDLKRISLTLVILSFPLCSAHKRIRSGEHPPLVLVDPVATSSQLTYFFRSIFSSSLPPRINQLFVKSDAGCG